MRITVNIIVAFKFRLVKWLRNYSYPAIREKWTEMVTVGLDLGLARTPATAKGHDTFGTLEMA